MRVILRVFYYFIKAILVNIIIKLEIYLIDLRILVITF